MKVDIDREADGSVKLFKVDFQGPNVFGARALVHMDDGTEYKAQVCFTQETMDDTGFDVQDFIENRAFIMAVNHQLKMEEWPDVIR